MSYKRRTDVVARGLGVPGDPTRIGRKLEQYKGKSPVLDAWITAYLAQVQALEDSVYAVYRSRWIDIATGRSLDAIGQLVGRPRMGMADALYRAFIRTQVIANRSRGTINDLKAVAKALVGQTTNVTVYENIGAGAANPRAVQVTINGVVDPAVAPYVGQIIKSAKPIGVQMQVVYPVKSPVFAFAGGSLPYAVGGFGSVSDPDYPGGGYLSHVE